MIYFPTVKLHPGWLAIMLDQSQTTPSPCTLHRVWNNAFYIIDSSLCVQREAILGLSLCFFFPSKAPPPLAVWCRLGPGWLGVKESLKAGGIYFIEPRRVSLIAGAAFQLSLRFLRSTWQSKTGWHLLCLLLS